MGWKGHRIRDDSALSVAKVCREKKNDRRRKSSTLKTGKERRVGRIATETLRVLFEGKM